jgi:dTDP-4-dehydrorhamnose 3,5-epimerase
VSATGVLRGRHFQRTAPQGKRVSVIARSIFDVAVDTGFCVTDGPATVHYRCTSAYLPMEQGGLAWDDPSIGIEWPILAPIVSLKDRSQPSL